MKKPIDIYLLKEKNDNFGKIAFMIKGSEIAYDKHFTNPDPKAMDKERSYTRYLEMGFTSIRFIENTDTDTQCYVCSDINNICVFFRGTENSKDWNYTNFDMEKEYPHELTMTKTGKVHQGFHRAMSSVFDNIYEYIISIPEYRSRNLYVAGHSLGAALTTQFVNFFDYKIPITCGYAVASPKSGDNDFVKQFDKRFKERFYRLTNNTDIVCKVPLYIQGFYHVEEEIYITSDRKIKRMNFFTRAIDQFVGGIKGIFTDTKGSLDDHHPCFYFNAFAESFGNEERLLIWPEYRD